MYTYKGPVSDSVSIVCSQLIAQSRLMRPTLCTNGSSSNYEARQALHLDLCTSHDLRCATPRVTLCDVSSCIKQISSYYSMTQLCPKHISLKCNTIYSRSIFYNDNYFKMRKSISNKYQIIERVKKAQWHVITTRKWSLHGYNFLSCRAICRDRPWYSVEEDYGRRRNVGRM